MKEKQKVKLSVQPIYSTIIWIVLLLAFIALLVFPNILWNDHGKLIWRIIFNVCFSLFACLSLIAFLHYIQMAVISSKGILIKTPFRKIIFIEWHSISELSKQKVVTYNSRGSICLNWLVFKTDNCQVLERGGVNKSSKGPWQIKATKKNITVIKSFLVQYCPKLKNKLD